MADKKMYKYQVIVGVHAEPIDKVVDKYDAQGNVTKETVRELVMYGENDYFESPSPNLVKRLGADKFLKLPDNFNIEAARRQQQAGEAVHNDDVPQLPSSTLNFNDWTEKELRSYAAEEEIDVSKAKNKADLVAVIQLHTQSLANSK